MSLLPASATTTGPAIAALLAAQERDAKLARIVTGIGLVRGARVLEPKAKRGRSNSPTIPRMPFGTVPERISVTLRYGVLYQPGTAATFTQVFRASPYDPDFTGTGSQPLGFDQYTALYRSYIVTKCRLRTKATPSSTTFMYLSQWVSLVTTAPVTDNAVLAQPGSHFGVARSGTPPIELDTGWTSVPPMFGMTLDEYRAVEDFYGSDSADPVSVVYPRFYATCDGTTTFSFSAVALLELEVEFFRPVQLASS